MTDVDQADVAAAIAQLERIMTTRPLAVELVVALDPLQIQYLIVAVDDDLDEMRCVHLRGDLERLRGGGRLSALDGPASDRAHETAQALVAWAERALAADGAMAAHLQAQARRALDDVYDGDVPAWATCNLPLAFSARGVRFTR